MTLLPSRALWAAVLAATACCAAPAVAAAAPSVADETATGLGLVSGTLSATVNPNGLPTTYHFEYGISTAYGAQVPLLVDSPVGADTTAHTVTEGVAGLLPTTVYHFRAVATDCAGCPGGTSYGADQTFTTAAPPLAGTGTASEVKATHADLNGTVNPNGLPSTFHFDYGPAGTYGSSTPESSTALSGLVGVAASATARRLTPTTDYHFRLVATNCGGCAAGTVYGVDQTFVTAADDGTDTSDASDADEATGVEDPADGDESAEDSLASGVPGSPIPAPGAAPGTTAVPASSAGSAGSQGDTAEVLRPGAPLSSGTALGRREVVAPASGKVFFELPGSSKLQPLTEASSVPLGSLIDTRGGIVTLTVALGPVGSTQSAILSRGVFRARQSLSQHGMTDLLLAGGNFAVCGSPTAARARQLSLVPAAFTARSVVASAARARPRVVRSLWASDQHGRFRTYGRNSVATVRGTRWVTEDRCDGTLTGVQQGQVSVKGTRSRRAVLVGAGHSYLARP